MCNTTLEMDLCHLLNSTLQRQRPSKRPNFRVHRLTRRRRFSKVVEKERARVLKREMEIKNLELFMQNQSIMEENDKLRKKALLLHQENKVLLSRLQHISLLPNTISRTATSNTDHFI